MENCASAESKKRSYSFENIQAVEKGFLTFLVFQRFLLHKVEMESRANFERDDEVIDQRQSAVALETQAITIDEKQSVTNVERLSVISDFGRTILDGIRRSVTSWGIPAGTFAERQSVTSSGTNNYVIGRTDETAESLSLVAERLAAKSNEPLFRREQTSLVEEAEKSSGARRISDLSEDESELPTNWRTESSIGEVKTKLKVIALFYIILHKQDDTNLNHFMVNNVALCRHLVQKS